MNSSKRKNAAIIDIRAFDYTIDGQYSAAVLAIPKAVTEKIDKQIVHITSKRYLTKDGKLNHVGHGFFNPAYFG